MAKEGLSKSKRFLKEIKKEKSYNHMMDVAFTVVGPWEKEEDIPYDVLIANLEKRIRNLKKERDREAFGYSDSYEED